MAIRSPPRLDWAPGDRAIVSYRNRLVQLHDAAGRATRELASERIYDVRWRDDGQIVVLDDRGSVTFDGAGALVQQTHFRIDVLHAPHAASMSANGERYVALGAAELFAVQLETARPERIWTLHAQSYGISLGERGDRTASARVGIAMSPDGRLVAIGYPGGGRSWIVIEVDSDRFLQRSTIRMEAARIVGKANAPPLFAFDDAGARLAQAVPGPGACWGVTRLEVEDRELARTVPGGAHAVALDRGGLLAAYAYAKPPDGARGRLRIDYLAPDDEGAATVETLDTLSIDPDLPDVIALAFSRDSRQLACLASTGAIEIVPVP
ncbi:MAG: hypothetical protein ABI467_11190 [Kofleriaceae bacterium]